MSKLLLILPAVAILGGCTTTLPSIGACTNAKGVTPINITYQQQNNMVKVQVAPHRADVDRGDLIRFKINGNLGKTVSVKGKETDPDASWITGNGTSGEFYVCVPITTIKDQVYSYEVDVDEIGFLDPEVRVRN